MGLFNDIFGEYIDQVSDFKIVLITVVKAIISGLAIAFATVVIPQRTLRWGEVMGISLTAASVFVIMDIFFGTASQYVKAGSALATGISVVSHAAPIL